MMDSLIQTEQEAGGDAGSTPTLAESAAPPVAKSVTPDAFDWYDNPNIVQFEVPSVAVYTNTVNNIVIRQRQEWDEEDDTFIFIAPANARKVANAILRAADLADTESPPAKPKSAGRTRATAAQPDLLGVRP